MAMNSDKNISSDNGTDIDKFEINILDIRFQIIPIFS
jgi:hypothetical protein